MQKQTIPKEDLMILEELAMLKATITIKPSYEESTAILHEMSKRVCNKCNADKYEDCKECIFHKKVNEIFGQI